jgi:hypothetical protein
LGLQEKKRTVFQIDITSHLWAWPVRVQSFFAAT